jgi:hypothetical protein
MNQTGKPLPGSGERRKYFRREADNKVRVRLVSGEFDDPASSVNFAKRLVNYTQAGACVETTGRLRPDIKMKIELKFDAFNGHLRSQVQVVWADTRNQGASEVHLVGLRFVGPELTNAVRDFFEGDRASLIVSRRKAEYDDLKAKSTARKKNIGKKWSPAKKTLVPLLLAIFVYFAAFGGLITAGRMESSAPGVHFRYLKDGAADEAVSRVFFPLYWAARKAGVDLVHEPVNAPKP